MGVVKHFTRAKNGQVKIIWIQLENPNDGINYCEKYIGLYKKDNNISKNWTPIFAQAKSFNIGGCGRGQKYFEVCRIQIPLVSDLLEHCGKFKELQDIQQRILILMMNIHPEEK